MWLRNFDLLFRIEEKNLEPRVYINCTVLWFDYLKTNRRFGNDNGTMENLSRFIQVQLLLLSYYCYYYHYYCYVFSLQNDEISKIVQWFVQFNCYERMEERLPALQERLILFQKFSMAVL